MKKEIISYHLGRFATVFQAEIFGLKQAAGTLMQKEITGRNICIPTDNQAGIKALQNI